MRPGPDDLVRLRTAIAGYGPARDQLMVFAAGSAARVLPEGRSGLMLIEVHDAGRPIGTAPAHEGELELIERCQRPLFED